MSSVILNVFFLFTAAFFLCMWYDNPYKKLKTYELELICAGNILKTKTKDRDLYNLIVCHSSDNVSEYYHNSSYNLTINPYKGYERTKSHSNKYKTEFVENDNFCIKSEFYNLSSIAADHSFLNDSVQNRINNDDSILLHNNFKITLKDLILESEKEVHSCSHEKENSNIKMLIKKIDELKDNKIYDNKILVISLYCKGIEQKFYYVKNKFIRRFKCVTLIKKACEVEKKPRNH